MATRIKFHWVTMQSIFSAVIMSLQLVEAFRIIEHRNNVAPILHRPTTSSQSWKQQRSQDCAGGGVCATQARFDRPTNIFTFLSMVKWDVYVDQSKSSMEKGGGATLDAFSGLAPIDQVTVHPVILDRTKLKGPVVRCISSNRKNSFDVANVDSVEKVVRILRRHMQLRDVNTKTCECLKWKYKGNGLLEAGHIAGAIAAYDQALTLQVTSQEGILLLMRATAHLQRAVAHRDTLKQNVHELTDKSLDVMQVFSVTSNVPVLSPPVFRRLLQSTEQSETQFRQTQYRHGLYQYALLQAAQDALRATQLLPDYADSWRRAAEILSELWKLKESAQYFARAMELDDTLENQLQPVIDRIKKRQELLESARAFGWSEDALRLALDVSRNSNRI